jgi:hypothetical protein
LERFNLDRNIKGLIAGITGGIIMGIWSFFSYHILSFAKLRYADWASLLIFGEKPSNIYMLILATIAHIMWSGFLGVIFAFLIPIISSRYYLIKGAFYGFMTSFLIYTIPSLFGMPRLSKISLETAVTDILGGLIWGITTILVLRILDTTPRIH